MLYAHNIVYRVCQCGPKPKINVHVAKNKSTLCRITTLSRKKNDKIEMVATKMSICTYTHLLMKPDIVDISVVVYINFQKQLYAQRSLYGLFIRSIYREFCL